MLDEPFLQSLPIHTYICTLTTPTYTCIYVLILILNGIILGTIAGLFGKAETELVSMTFVMPIQDPPDAHDMTQMSGGKLTALGYLIRPFAHCQIRSTVTCQIWHPGLRDPFSTAGSAQLYLAILASRLLMPVIPCQISSVTSCQIWLPGSPDPCFPLPD